MRLSRAIQNIYNKTFSIGDDIECVYDDNGYYKYLTSGVIYRIKSIQGDYFYLEKDDQGDEYDGHLISRFKKAT